MLSANSEHFTPFPAWISFIFLLWMPWLGPPELCWIKVVRVDGHACLVLILEEMPLGFQHQECCLLWVCHIRCLSCWGTFPLYPLSEGFFKIMNGCWTLPQAFSASSQMITWFQLFNLSVQCVTLIDLWILKKPCVPGINPAWSRCLALCCWIQSATLLLRAFASMFTSDVGLYFSFCEIFVWFGCQGNAGFLE